VDDVHLDCSAIVAQVRIPFRRGVSDEDATAEEWQNLRLIAAAPELLAACEHVRDTIREFLPTVMSEDLTAIEAAIAKAKGTKG
jgi:hypothetical protein